MSYMENYTKGYYYDSLIEEWKLQGYICKKCGRTVKSLKVLPRHVELCKGKSIRQFPVEPLPPNIYDINGNEWMPLDKILEKQKTPLMNTGL
jgi:hypothetical protein